MSRKNDAQLRIPLFKKRHVRFIDALKSSAVAVVPMFLAIVAFVVAYVLGSIDSNRAILGVVLFCGILVVAVVMSYASLRYHTSGTGSDGKVQ